MGRYKIDLYEVSGMVFTLDRAINTIAEIYDHGGMTLTSTRYMTFINYATGAVDFKVPHFNPTGSPEALGHNGMKYFL